MGSFRVDKMASFIQTVVSEIVRHRLNDPRISPHATVTRVEVSRDLQVAKVFVSVLGSEADGRRTLAALKHAGGHIQRMVAQSLQTRHCPELRLEWDETMRRTVETLEIIERNAAERALRGTPSESPSASAEEGAAE